MQSCSIARTASDRPVRRERAAGCNRRRIEPACDAGRGRSRRRSGRDIRAGAGGIEHFFQQFTGPMTVWWKVLGSPELTPEVQRKLIDSVHAEVGSRTIEELAAERDNILLGFLE